MVSQFFKLPCSKSFKASEIAWKCLPMAHQCKTWHQNRYKGHCTLHQSLWKLAPSILAEIVECWRNMCASLVSWCWCKGSRLTLRSIHFSGFLASVDCTREAYYLFFVSLDIWKSDDLTTFLFRKALHSVLSFCSCLSERSTEVWLFSSSILHKWVDYNKSTTCQPAKSTLSTLLTGATERSSYIVAGAI